MIGAIVAAVITTPIGYLIGATFAAIPYVASMGNPEAAEAGGSKGALIGLIIGVVVGALIGSVVNGQSDTDPGAKPR